MTDIKSIFLSKTIWGSVMVLVSTAATLAGYDIGDTDALVNNILAMVGAALAFYGRVVAVKKVAL